MTYTSINNQKPKLLNFNKSTTDNVNLIVRGQGIVVFKANQRCSLNFINKYDKLGLKVQFTNEFIIVTMKPSNEPLIDSKNCKGLTKNEGAYYWFSLDSQNLRLYAGIGETREENIIYSYTFSNKNNKDYKSFLESLVSIHCDDLDIIRLVRDPITSSIPLLVKNTEDLTMDDIAKGTYMPKANLSTMSQKLYDCIAGNKFVLNTHDFPDFMKAIEYSIATPGKWCYECLKKKANEFDKDKPNDKKTYLRITLGQNNGESPGIPYVMEIWPVGHYSPIHNHGESSAIIRVLNGSINISLFPYLSSDNVAPFAIADFKKDDITWISPTLNQVHQLKNLEKNKDTCVTIQCYMYENENTEHYDYFDYIDADNKIEQFEPNSDMDFVLFKQTIRKEWNERKIAWFCF
jgi:predicted metal-dependent enzyme (double-stranded beta helix superfamily)